LLQDCQIQEEFDVYSSLNKTTRFQLLDIASVAKIQFGGKNFIKRFTKSFKI
jgi:hypothetical protein